MDFYCARLGRVATDGIYVVSVGEKKLLVGASLNLDYLLQYLPNFGEFIDDSQLDPKVQKSMQQQKVVQGGKYQESNPYYIRVNGKNYMRYPVKFDLAHYDLLDLKDIDYILLPNLDSIGALPYLTEYAKFAGKILSTAPVIQVANYFLNEFCSQTLVANKTPKDQIGSFFEESKLFDVFEDEGIKLQEWVDIYSEADIQSSLSKAIPLNFSENYQIDDDLIITPVPSGYSFGSCNWTIQFKSHKIAVICNSSLDSSTYSKPIDVESLKYSEVAILTHCLNTKFIKSSIILQQDQGSKLSNGDKLKAELIEMLQAHFHSPDPGNVLLPMDNPQVLLSLL